MNIALISNLWPPTVFGGYEILASQVADTLRAQGHGVQVLTSSFVSGAPRWVTPQLELTTPFPRPGEDVGEVDFSLRRQTEVARRNRAVTRRWLDQLAGRFAGGRGADVVFCWCLNRLSLGPVRAAQDAGLPVCWTINDFHPRQFRTASLWGGPKAALRFAAERSLYAGTTLAGRPIPVAFISAALERGLAGEGVRFERGQVIHQGVPLADFPFAPRQRAAGEPLEVLYVGQLSQAKGVHTVIRAVAILTMRGVDARLRIVGDGVPSYRRYLDSLASDFGVEERVEFLGQVEHGGVADWHRRSHVLVFSSEWPEPFGLAHLEAMASGCAVVSTLTGGSAELIEDRVNALAFQAGHMDHLAFCLRRLADDEPLRQQLIRAARRTVEERFSLAAYCHRLTGFLEAVVREKSGDEHVGVRVPVTLRNGPLPTSCSRTLQPLTAEGSGSVRFDAGRPGTDLAL